MFHDFDVDADAKSVGREAYSRPLGPGSRPGDLPSHWEMLSERVLPRELLGRLRRDSAKREDIDFSGVRQQPVEMEGAHPHVKIEMG